MLAFEYKANIFHTEIFLLLSELLYTTILSHDGQQVSCMTTKSLSLAAPPKGGLVLYVVARTAFPSLKFLKKELHRGEAEKLAGERTQVSSSVSESWPCFQGRLPHGGCASCSLGVWLTVNFDFNLLNILPVLLFFFT